MAEDVNNNTGNSVSTIIIELVSSDIEPENIDFHNNITRVRDITELPNDIDQIQVNGFQNGDDVKQNDVTEVQNYVQRDVNDFQNDVREFQNEVTGIRRETEQPEVEISEAVSGGYISDINENPYPLISNVIEQCRNNRQEPTHAPHNIVYEAYAEQSTSHIISVQKPCRCNCHNMGEVNLSYDTCVDSNRDDSYDHDINCNGISCDSIPDYRMRAHTLQVGLRKLCYASSLSPSPSGYKRKLPVQMAKLLNSTGSSPGSGREPPNYRSLIFSILQDEPPKYEDVTGNKLATELIDVSTPNISHTAQTPTLKSRIAGVGIFIGVIIVTVLLLYLSVTGAGRRGASRSSGSP